MTDRAVRECLKRKEALCGTADETVASAAKRMAEAFCSSILICEGAKLLGIFTERDLLTRVVAGELDPTTTTLGSVMTPDPDTIEADAPVIDAIRRMDELNYRHLPVLDSTRIVGVISWRDLPFDERVGVEPELEQRHTLAERMW